MRLIYDGKEAYDNGEASSDRQIEVSAFNSSRDKVYYVGYMYTEGEQHGNTTNSTIKEVLDEWYRKNLLNTVYEVYIADSGFCNDREMASGSTWDVNPSGIIYYAGRERISTNKSPVFTCSNSADLYTASSSKGNRVLTYSIGLLTMDEVVFAGSGQSLSNSMYYLYTGEDYWTMTPMYAEAWEARVYYQSTEALTVGIVTQEYGVRPVINLSVNVNLTGSGTASDPYRLSGT